jgi:uncharacterized membrane protein
MEPAVGVAALWLLFAGTHVGLTIPSVRAAIIRRLGQGGFLAFFSLIASVTFVVLVGYYAAHRFDGAAGLDAGRWPIARWLLVGLAGLGVAFVVVGVFYYPSLGSALFQEAPRAPRGVESITRHPFFSGAALLGLAHAALAPHLAGAVFMGGLATLAVVGAVHQDRKLVAQRGAPYAHYLAATSAIPFAAILVGRQRLVWAELPMALFGAGILVAVGLRQVHAALFGHGGVWLSASIVGGGLVAMLQARRRARRR